MSAFNLARDTEIGRIILFNSLEIGKQKSLILIFKTKFFKTPLSENS